MGDKSAFASCSQQPIKMNSKIRKVVILSKVSIDNGAGGTRVSNLVDLLNSSSLFHTSAYVFSRGRKFGDEFDKTELSKFVSFDDYSDLSGLKKYKKLFYKKAVINNIFDREKPDIVIIYSVLSFRNVSFIKRYCKKHHIILIFDVVESRKLFSSYSLKSFFGYNLHNYLINHFYINKYTSGVICPTHYLKDYFEKKRRCKNVFLFPITMKIDLLPKYKPEHFKNSNKIVFMYAGNPANKRDLIVNMIKGFNLLSSEDRNELIFYVCGPTQQSLIDCEGLSDADFKESLSYSRYLGCLPKETLYRLLSNVDYYVLLKNPKRIFSKAGFPTKMAECFSCGIPMVANFSGDMSYYLVDSFNGIVCKTTDPLDFRDSLKRALELSREEHCFLSNNALLTAKSKLSNDVYYKSFTDFLESTK